METSGPRPRWSLAGAGLCAGFGVGLVDGARAGLAVGSDAVGITAAALLGAASDALLAVAVLGSIEALWRLALWGRRGRAPVRVETAVAGGWGMATALAVEAALVAMDARRNRLLVAGVAAGAAAAAASFGALTTPVLARLLARGGLRPPSAALAPWPTRLAALVVTLTLGGAGVFGLALRIHGPILGPISGPISGPILRPILGPILGPALAPLAWPWLAGIAVVAAILPLGLTRVSGLGARPGQRSGRRALLAVAVAWAGAAVVFVSASWESSLRFVPWTHVVVAAAIILVSSILTEVGPRCVRLVRGAFAARRVPVRRRSSSPPNSSRATAGWRRWRPWRRPMPVAILACAALTLGASESEPARKAIFTRAGLAGPALLLARSVLDRDGDGYSPLLGGGDCDDGDATIHPGMVDYPDDGIDQDCDGRDAHAATLVPPPFAAVPDAVPRALDLLLITIDTLRADHLGAYGYARPTSPELDRLAAEGDLFLNGWAHAPSTRYSMPAIATGRWPSAIEWDESIWWPRIGPHMRTLGEALEAAGYFTAAFYSFDYFSAQDRRGFERGIDLYRADRASLHRSVNGPMESRGSSSREMADDAIAFFEAHRNDKVFLWVHFYDPHLSYEPHPEVPSFGSGRMDLYDGEIRFTDLHVGRLLRRLRELGLWERTAVVVTGDHGEGFGEHGITEHGFDLYPAQTKVPFIIRVPGLPAGRIERPVGHVDLAPTLLNLARAPQEPSFLGRSLVPELSGAAGAREGDGPPVFQEVTSERGKKRALVTRDWHLIWNWTPDNTTECYDRRVDPGDLHDLWGHRDASACGSLKTTLEGMVSALSVPADLGAKLRAGVFAPGIPLPPPRVPLDARVGPGMRVLGVSSGPTRIRGGQPLDVELQLECLRPIPAGWRTFFHLLGPGGSFRNLDHVPVDGAMPLERWKPRQRIVDRFRIALPVGTPPGRYLLVFGVFRGAERAPVSPPGAADGNDAVRLLELELL
jgi:arylsulfatase A-like enzyme